MHAPSPLGELIADRFRVTALLGNTRGGAVYLAEQIPLGRAVEFKLLDALPEDDPRRKRFFREAQALVKLTHPNILRVFDQGDWHGRTYLVVEHIEGRRLDEVLAERALPPIRIVTIARDVASALAEAHQHGLIHRDLRPANILLARTEADQELVKVLDFGLVKDLSAEEGDTTAEGVTIGSPWFMPPEQLRGQALDPRADVYALGVVLFRALSGRLPFNEPAAMLERSADAPAPPLSDELPLSVRQTVAICLAKSADQRFADMTEVGKALAVCAVALVDPAWGQVPVSVRDGRAVVPEVVPADPYLRTPPPAEFAPRSASVWPWVAVAGVLALIALVAPVAVTLLAIAIAWWWG